MRQCFFVSDIHGRIENYEKLFNVIESERPEAVFLGGDLLPSGLFAFTKKNKHVKNFLSEIMIPGFKTIRNKLKEDYPHIFLILGNDDGKFEEEDFKAAEKNGIWEYIHGKKTRLQGFSVYGYSYVPPTPFLLKDWERYDVSRFVDPGCVSPEEGQRSTDIPENHTRYATIQKDLDQLYGKDDLSQAILLFHTPPYQTKLDRAALDGKMIDYVPMDVHVGSIAVKRLIEERQPLITLHGHVHESARLTGSWKDRIGETYSFSAAHDGDELALIRFDPKNPDNSSRELI